MFDFRQKVKENDEKRTKTRKKFKILLDFVKKIEQNIAVNARKTNMTCNVYIYCWDLAAAAKGAEQLGKTLAEAILSYMPERESAGNDK